MIVISTVDMVKDQCTLEYRANFINHESQIVCEKCLNMDAGEETKFGDSAVYKHCGIVTAAEFLNAQASGCQCPKTARTSERVEDSENVGNLLEGGQWIFTC